MKNNMIFVDAEKGKDKNSGSIKRPLKTIAEAFKRLEGHAIYTYNIGDMIIVESFSNKKLLTSINLTKKK